MLLVAFHYKGQLGQALSLTLGIYTDCFHLKQNQQPTGPEQNKAQYIELFSITIAVVIF